MSRSITGDFAQKSDGANENRNQRLPTILAAVLVSKIRKSTLEIRIIKTSGDETASHPSDRRHRGNYQATHRRTP